ncbi:MAG: hypothetical protein JJE55_04605 [Flavobacteriaceae bacterium]|nr:hypothetical protein [Flavobacteriaceae bacterium]
MKNLNLLIAILITTILFSCSSKDDDNSNRSSGFSVEGKYYPTPNGYIVTNANGTHNYPEAFYLSNGTIINNEWTGGNHCDFSNDLTQSVIFYIQPTLLTELTDGTYNYELNTTEPFIQHVNFGVKTKILNNCIFSEVSMDTPQFESGNLKIVVSGNIYKITYSFQRIDDEIIEGTYTGELQLVQDLR